MHLLIVSLHSTHSLEHAAQVFPSTLTVPTGQVIKHVLLYKNLSATQDVQLSKVLAQVAHELLHF